MFEFLSVVSNLAEQSLLVSIHRLDLQVYSRVLLFTLNLLEVQQFAQLVCTL